ncbi:MAG: helix-turn-helix domain-containing protein [Rubritalea sp.]
MINTCWLKPFADYFTAREISLEPYCLQAQIELSHVTLGDGWITKHQLYLFLEALAKGEKMPEVGFVVGELITPNCLGALGEAMAQQTTLGGVIRTFGQLINRHVEGNHCWLEEGENGEVWLFNEKSHSPEHGRTIADHAGLMSMINLVRLITGPSWHPAKACLQTDETNLYMKLQGFGGCQMAFKKRATGFAFPASWLLHSTKGNPFNPEHLQQSPGLLNEGEPITTKIRLILTEIIGVGGILPSASLAADLIGISLRSLHRTLSSHGTSYQRILDTVRLTKATSLLEDTDSSIADISVDLGFSGANNFIRSFKKTNGMTPGAYRLARNPS